MPITGDIDIGKWLSTMYQDYLGGRGRKETMFGKGVSALESYADIFKPGGAYGAGVEATISRGEEKAVASGMQSLVSAGLAGTTMPMHLQQTFEEEIGMPTRMRAEDRRLEGLGSAYGALGQMYAGYDPGTATAGDVAHMATGGFGALQTGRIADMQAQQRARETYDPYPSGRFEDQFSRGGTFGGGGTGGGISTDPLQHLGGGGFANPYGGDYGGGGFAEGELPVMMGGQRIEPGTEDIWKPKISRQAAAQLGIDPLSRGYTYDVNQGAYIAPTGGQATGGMESVGFEFQPEWQEKFGIGQFL